MKALASLCWILAAALYLAPGAAATIPPGNLLGNPGAEEGPAATSTTEAFPINGWAGTGNPTAVRYGAPGLMSAANGAEVNGGLNFFAGGPTGASQVSASQMIDVSIASSEIDAGTVQITLTGCLGGKDDQGDTAVLYVVFRDGSNSSLGSDMSIQSPFPPDRGNITKLVPKAHTGNLPMLTRKMEVAIVSIGNSGGYSDGYADNLSVSLAAAGMPAPSPQCTPAPSSGGGGPPAGAPAVKVDVKSLLFERRAFAALASGPSVLAADRVAKKKRATPTGSRISYSLAQGATVEFTVERAIKGRRKGKKCVPRRKKGKRCTAYKKAKGTFTHAGQAGANSFKFSGRVRGSKLRPGNYRLVAVAVNAVGTRGTPTRTAFRIKR